MSDNWQPGDLALCVRQEVFPPPRITVLGGIYTVERVWAHPDGGLALDFVGMDNGSPSGKVAAHWGFDPTRFRKIHPHTPDAEDRRTIELLNGAPVKERVS